jgi:hypothetical protein
MYKSVEYDLPNLEQPGRKNFAIKQITIIPSAKGDVYKCAVSFGLLLAIRKGGQVLELFSRGVFCLGEISVSRVP